MRVSCLLELERSPARRRRSWTPTVGPRHWGPGPQRARRAAPCRGKCSSCAQPGLRTQSIEPTSSQGQATGVEPEATRAWRPGARAGCPGSHPPGCTSMRRRGCCLPRARAVLVCSVLMGAPRAAPSIMRSTTLGPGTRPHLLSPHPCSRP